MEKPPSLEESDVDEVKIDIHQGIEIRIKNEGPDLTREPFSIIDNPRTIIESVGNIDSTKLYVSDKEIDAAIYLTEKSMETCNCSKVDVQTQYEHQKLSPEVLARFLMSQKMERFLKNVVPIMEEEVRQNAILENILW